MELPAPLYSIRVGSVVPMRCGEWYAKRCWRWMTSLKRAGADAILTYFAKDATLALQQ